jgi:hypothetical protein
MTWYYSSVPLGKETKAITSGEGGREGRTWNMARKLKITENEKYTL